MQQLDIPFRLTLIDVLDGEHRSKQYLDINPLGRVPYMRLTDGRAISESNAMLWYLSEGSFLMPDDPVERAQALQWMFFEQTALEPHLSPARFLTTILSAQRETRAHDIAAMQAKAKPGLERLESRLKGRDFLLESGYSVADISLYGYVHVLDEAGLRFSDYPSIQNWVSSVASTEGFVPLAELGQRSRHAA